MTWLAVAAVMTLLLIQRALFVKGLVAQAQYADDSVNKLLGHCCAQMRIKHRIRLKVSANATSPAVCGLFRPAILIPHSLTQSLRTSQLEAVLLHELAHIKRGDLWINLVLTPKNFYNTISNSLTKRNRHSVRQSGCEFCLLNSVF